MKMSRESVYRDNPNPAFLITRLSNIREVEP